MGRVRFLCLLKLMNWEKVSVRWKHFSCFVLPAKSQITWSPEGLTEVLIVV